MEPAFPGTLPNQLTVCPYKLKGYSSGIGSNLTRLKSRKMKISFELKSLLEQGLSQMRRDPEHNLNLSIRSKLYELLEPDYSDNKICKAWGWLGILSTQRVLFIWQHHLRIWDGIENDFANINIKELPEYLLSIAKEAVQGVLDLNNVKKQIDLFHEVVGAVGDEIFEYMENGPKEVVCVSDAAYNTLYQLASKKPLASVKDWKTQTDDSLPTEMLDVAGSAMLAYAGGNDIGAVKLNKRLEFWEWWLTEAVPQAWELAQQASTTQDHQDKSVKQ